MKECKYNDFKVRFISPEELYPTHNFTRGIQYDLSIFQEGIFDRIVSFERSKNQIVFDANKHMQELGNCEKFIVLKNGVNDFSLLWTSFKGNAELINMKGGMSHLFDYLFLSFCKKKQKVLYIGNQFEAPVAAWRNAINIDVVGEYSDNMLDLFLKRTQEAYLPF